MPSIELLPAGWSWVGVPSVSLLLSIFDASIYTLQLQFFSSRFAPSNIHAYVLIDAGER